MPLSSNRARIIPHHHIHRDASLTSVSTSMFRTTCARRGCLACALPAALAHGNFVFVACASVLAPCLGGAPPKNAAEAEGEQGPPPLVSWLFGAGSPTTVSLEETGAGSAE